MGDCYVCMEHTVTKSPCECTTMYLCENCLVKLKLYKHSHCTICHSLYPLTKTEVVDLELFLEETEREQKCTYTPFCCRTYEEIRNPKHCCTDMLFHTICNLSLTYVTCFIWDRCTNDSFISSLVISLVVYVFLSSFLIMMCRRAQ